MQQDLKVGDVVPSALDTAYAGYSQWCSLIGISPAPFEVWVKHETHNGHSLSSGKGFLLQSRQQQALWRLQRMQ